MKGVTPILLSAFCVLVAFTFCKAEKTACSPQLMIGLRGFLRVGNTLPDLPNRNKRNWNYNAYNMRITRVVLPTLTCNRYGNLFHIRMAGAAMDMQGRWSRRWRRRRRRHNDMSGSVSGVTMNIYTTFRTIGGRIHLDHVNPSCYASVSHLNVQLGGRRGLVRLVFQAVINVMNAHLRDQMEGQMCQQIKSVLGRI